MADSISYAINNTNSSANLKLDNPLKELPQVSDARSNALANLGINNIRQLINYFPRTYIDLSKVSTILDSKIGFNYTISATVHSVEEKEPKPGMKLIEITICDETGTLIATAFNQNWLLDTVKPQDKIAISGKVEFSYGFKRMTNPFIYVLDDKNSLDDIEKIIPIYNASEKISSTWIKNIIRNAFEYVGSIQNVIPQNLVDKYKLMNYFDALYKCHFPASMNELGSARRTIKYNQVLLQQLNLLKNSNLDAQNNLLSFEFVEDKIQKAAEAISLYKDNGSQAIMLVSSSTLLHQYKELLKENFKDLHVAFQIIDSLTSKENKWKAYYDFKNGDLDLIIATKTILEDEIESKKLGLLIVDEKTNFTNSEIKIFQKFANDNTDKLYLTSKPTTQSMTKLIYPECEISHIAFQKSYKCNVKVMQKDDIAIVYDECLKKTYDDEQLVIICPFTGINSEKRNEMAGIGNPNINVKVPTNEVNYEIVSMDNKLENVDNSAESLKKYYVFENRIFKECSNALISSNMDCKDKLKILQDFANNKITVLICTSENDFFISSKNKFSIIIEDADRIGLSTIYQFRNFALKNSDEANIYLVSTSKRKDSFKRLNLMSDIMDGETLVSKDLEMRQEGSSLGLQNWGFSELKLINVVRDKAIIDTANKDAKEIIAKDSNLNNAENRLLSYEISRTFKD